MSQRSAGLCTRCTRANAFPETILFLSRIISTQNSCERHSLFTMKINKIFLWKFKITNVHSRKSYCRFFQMLNVINSSKIYLKWLNNPRSKTQKPVSLYYSNPPIPHFFSQGSQIKKKGNKRSIEQQLLLSSLWIYYLKLDDLIFFPMFHIVVCR